MGSEAVQAEKTPGLVPSGLIPKTLLTLALAGGILWWASRGVSSDELRATLQGIHLGPVAVAIGIFTVAFFVVEIVALGISWRRCLDPGVRWRDVRALVCGKQVLFAIQPLLTKLVAPLYFWRTAKVPPWRSLSATELVGVCELTMVMALVTGGGLFLDVDVGAGLWAALAGWWLLVAIAIVWMASPRLRQRVPRLRDAGVLHAFTTASPRDILKQLALRAALQAVTLACIWVLLSEMGARLSLAQLLAFGPLFIYAGLLPVSIGGFGGPQGFAVAVLASRWGALSADQALAFSLVWSSGVLLGGTAVGLVHLPRMIGLLRKRRSPA